MRRLLLFTICCATTIPCTAASQTGNEPELGQRVRVTLTHEPQALAVILPPRVIEGTLLLAGTDSLTLHTRDTEPRQVARARIRRIDVSEGRLSRSKSAVRGALFMALSSGFLAWTNSQRFGSPEQAISVGVGGGALFGLVSGALFPVERWRRIPPYGSMSTTPPSMPTSVEPVVTTP